LSILFLFDENPRFASAILGGATAGALYKRVSVSSQPDHSEIPSGIENRGASISDHTHYARVEKKEILTGMSVPS
jgi:hypothetical protein